MTRIIAGIAGSLPLAVPKRGTRPTSDRVREAIFSALESRGHVAGARVGDLYAGSGALGLEAASRQAASVVLVEKDRQAAAICRRNAESVRRTAGVLVEITVVAASVAQFLSMRNLTTHSLTTSSLTTSSLTASTAAFDLVFIDPPYDLDERALSDTLTALVPHLAPDAVLLVERSARSPEPAWPTEIALDRRKDYGDTTLWWAQSTATPAKSASPR